MTDWFDRNKFKEILAIIDSNKFNYRNKIGEFKYIGWNTNEIKDAEIIKYKNCTSKHKELLNLFNNLLDTILTDKTLESKSQEDKNENENDKTMSSKDENENAKNKKKQYQYQRRWEWKHVARIYRRCWW